MRPKASVQSHRKDEHFFLAEKFFTPEASAGFDQVRFIRSSLPETRLTDVDFTSTYQGYTWPWPIFINAMTGGSPATGKVNAALARVARDFNLAMACGSASILAHEPNVKDTFTVVRQENPDGFILANLGADKTPALANQIVETLTADALEIHLNAPQELVMPEGERDFNWQKNIAAIIQGVKVPVIVKEVGFGMRHDDFDTLAELGAAAIDVGGRGGTNFIQIENVRRPHGDYTFLNQFGQTTVESLIEGQDSPVPLIATGGIRTPLDVLVALRLGAQAVGIAGLFLHWYTKEGEAGLRTHLADFLAQLKGITALLGAHDLASLRQVPIVLNPELHSYIQQRGLKMPH